jgi:hypothetical protein
MHASARAATSASAATTAATKNGRCMRVVSLLLHSCCVALLESDGAESAQAGGNFVLFLPCLLSLPTACRRRVHRM